jgi:hypothetical protein
VKWQNSHGARFAKTTANCSNSLTVLPVYIFKSMFLDNLWLWDKEWKYFGKCKKVHVLKVRVSLLWKPGTRLGLLQIQRSDWLLNQGPLRTASHMRHRFDMGLDSAVFDSPNQMHKTF